MKKDTVEAPWTDKFPEYFLIIGQLIHLGCPSFMPISPVLV